MTAACLTVNPPVPRTGFDILRGVGLAVSVAIILVIPAALAVMAIVAA